MGSLRRVLQISSNSFYTNIRVDPKMMTSARSLGNNAKGRSTAVQAEKKNLTEVAEEGSRGGGRKLGAAEAAMPEAPCRFLVHILTPKLG